MKFENLSFFSMIEVNPVLSQLYFFTRGLCHNAKIISINEFDNDLCSVRINSHSHMAPIIYLSPTSSFNRKRYIKFDASLSRLKSPKLLVIYDMKDKEFIGKICHLYRPDIVIDQNFEHNAMTLTYPGSFLNYKENRDYLPSRFWPLDLDICGNVNGFDCLIEMCNRMDNIFRIGERSSGATYNFSSVRQNVRFFNFWNDRATDWTWIGPRNSVYYCSPLCRKERQVRISIHFSSSLSPLSQSVPKFFLNNNLLQITYNSTRSIAEARYDNFNQHNFLILEMRSSRHIQDGGYAELSDPNIKIIEIEDFK